jgi:hypothetical protein
MISKMLFRAVSAAVLALLGAAALAAEYPTPKQGDWVAHDFRFHTGEMMSEVRLHYTTCDPSGIPVVVLHGSGGSANNMLPPHLPVNYLALVSHWMQKNISSLFPMHSAMVVAQSLPMVSERNFLNTITATW